VLTIGASVFVGPHIDLTGIRIAAAQSVPLVRDSVGRSDGSAGEREQLFQEGTRLWFSGQGTGFGPARTKATLLAFQAPYVKEAHNDYLATLLERGPVGVIGLVLLAAATVRNLRQLWRTPLSGRWHDAVPRAWALVVTAPVVAFAGAFYEVLHFRHLWTWLGLVAALAMVREQARFALPQERS
jgi:O-antigen ligase